MKNRVLGLALAQVATLAALASEWVKPANPRGPFGTGGLKGSFRHRDTKKHFSREGRNLAYYRQRRANRLRRKAGA